MNQNNAPLSYLAMINRRRFLGGLALTAAALAVPAVVRQVIQRTRRTIRLGPVPGPAVRLAHLSDLHSSSSVSLEFIRGAVDMVVAEAPHLVVLTGDFVTDSAPDPDGLAHLLRRLSAGAPTFACLGNHDGGRWAAARQGPATPDAVVDILQAAGVRVLRNETELVQVNGRALLLTGVEDLWSLPIDPRRAGFQAEPRPRLVLAHNPDTKDELAREPWDLMLCGHTHGGQVRLPFFGGRLTAPVRDTRFIEGLLPWGERHLHISRGVGCLHGLRLNCPPEVNLLDLV